MAFSFRAGTNWCHDFPKLARESGFFFNMHRTRVRVDWNRISSIDVDQVISDSDFQTVDDNVNNVIDYSLEHEYDVKILDPNFVKLFHLAQLSVEYLLYCKQYLDQSVVILKDELKLKIEENVRLKKEISSVTESFKDFREKSRIMDSKLNDPHGEVHKCPFCSRSFISAMYMNAHVNRRHSTSSPVPEEYKSETEKLHNEIKSLKERLNETEKVINESKKWSIEKAEKTEECKLSSEEKKYTEEANQALITEMKLRMENDIESVQSKLSAQESYWKSKAEELESRHRLDTETVFSQLKISQRAASNMKSEYESKIKDLEKQLSQQSEILGLQSERLNSISRGMQESQIPRIEKVKSQSEMSDSGEEESLKNGNLEKSDRYVAKKLEEEFEKEKKPARRKWDLSSFEAKEEEGESTLSSENETTEETITEDYYDYGNQDLKDLKDLKEDLEDVFFKKMRNLGIDPDWESIPKATFKHKSEILMHHQSINAKKFPQYERIREKVLAEISRKTVLKQREPKKEQPLKQNLLNKMVGNVKMKAMRALNIQKNSGTLPRRKESKTLKDLLPKRMSLEDLSPKMAYQRYDNIEDFQKGQPQKEETESISRSTESDEESEKLATIQNFFMSPKSSKSALKSIAGSSSTGSKKKVEFDLQKEKLAEVEFNLSSNSTENKDVDAFLKKQDDQVVDKLLNNGKEEKTTSALDEIIKDLSFNSSGTMAKLPQAAPRTLKKETKDSDLEKDLNEVLTIE